MSTGRYAGGDHETRWLHELSERWGGYNFEYLDGRLSRPTLKIDYVESRLGQWNPQRRCISISARHITHDPWLEVLETLRHEMAHQYADEILRATDEAPHGAAFQRGCELLRVGPAARDSCDQRLRFSDEGAADVRSKVEKLLSLATSPNENEAQVAMKKARELLLRHEISPARPRRDFFIRQVGPLKKRHETWEYQLGSILSTYFFVEGIWARSFDAAAAEDGTRLEIYGAPHHLDMAEYAHSYLSRVLPDLWQGYKRAHGLTADRDRRSYFSGVLVGFRQRLAEQDREFKEAYALVPAGDPRLEQFFNYVNPRTRNAGSRTIRGTAAYHHGIDQGRSVTIAKPLTSEGGGGGLLKG